MAEENKAGLDLKTLLIFGLIMIIIAGLTSFGLMTVLNASNSDGEKKVEAKADKIGPTYTLGDFVVNLAGSGGYQYIKASIVVEVDQEKVIEELDRRSPQVRDTIITTLRDQKREDIEEPGAGIIKNQIQAKLNQILATGKVQHVWFTQLVVQ